MNRHRYRDRRQRTSAGAATEECTFGPPNAERRYVITRHAVRDVDSTPTGAITILVRGHGYDHPVNEVPAPAVGRLYTFDDEIHLFPGESLVASFAGSTTGDALELFHEGWWEQAVPPDGA